MKEFIVKKTPHKPLIRNIEEYVSRVDTLDSDITSLDSRVDDTEKSISQLNYKLSNISVDMMTPIAYSELKSLRNNSKLTPGMFYRITDYQCTTTQANTRAMDNKFDVIIQALSNNTLSEKASADYHYSNQSASGGTPTIIDSAIESEGVLVEGSVTPYYYEYIDFAGPGEGLMEYKTMDGFIAYDYLENNDGQTVPVIYKTDVEAAIDDPDAYGQPDYQDEFYYVGRATIDGVPYDKWRKIFNGKPQNDDELTWDSKGRVYLYTNVIVEDKIEQVVDGISPDVANIPAWELKYYLDNDTKRFAWADGEQGKGIIYYMKDEWNNECPYDFKNIQFQRSAEWQKEHSDFITSLGLAVDDLEWFYTFSYINMENLTAEDLTLKQDLRSDKGGLKYGTHDNSMLPYRQDAASISKIALNNNIMIHCPAAYSIFYGCYGNTFGNDCHSNTFGTDCFYNTFGNGCYSNTFENYCHSNTFGNGCHSNTFEDYCHSNTFGNGCCRNTFGGNCCSNTFGNECYSNTFGFEYQSNTFGNYCHHDTFGTMCYFNTFGNGCSSNTFGDYCSSNTFGNDCVSNTFGSSADSLIANAQYIRFADGCRYVKLLNSESGDYGNCVQNITISAGVSGTQKSPLELQVSRNAPPVVYEAAGTTHITLD